jgi:hypothetical protein
MWVHRKQKNGMHINGLFDFEIGDCLSTIKEIICCPERSWLLRTFQLFDEDVGV